MKREDVERGEAHPPFDPWSLALEFRLRFGAWDWVIEHQAPSVKDQTNANVQEERTKRRGDNSPCRAPSDPTGRWSGARPICGRPAGAIDSTGALKLVRHLAPVFPNHGVLVGTELRWTARLARPALANNQLVTFNLIDCDDQLFVSCSLIEVRPI